jgi:ribosome biogenesis GTPase
MGAMQQFPFMTINDLGWQVYTTKIPDATRHNPQHVGRVVFQDATRYGVFSNHGETEGIVRGAMRRGAAFSSQLPKVGDWVVIEPLPGEAKVVIKEVLPRFSKISRKALGKKGEEQVVACNINTAFIVEGLDNDFNLNRLERYLAAIIQSGAQPVILLNTSVSR